MDENTQYENAMTKSLPIGCIKKKKFPPSNNSNLYFKISLSITKLDIYLQSISNLMKKPEMKKHFCLMKFIHLYLRKKNC